MPLQPPDSKLHDAKPSIYKTIPCLRCAADTTQQLVPYPKGSAWQCQVCQTQLHAFTHEQMMQVVMHKVFGIPEEPKKCDIPEGMLVYMEHFGPDAKEKEVAEHVVKEHVAITGTLPVEGKPLFVRPPGATDVRLAVPFGKVTRVCLPQA